MPDDHGATALDELRDWGARMRQRTCRQFELAGSTPAGWHVLLPDGDFGFLDVRAPATAEDHARLVQEARAYMRDMRARACLFSMEHPLADGRPALFAQFEAVDARGRRERALHLHLVVTTPEGRHVDVRREFVPAGGRDAELRRFGMFPDLLPEPPSPLRIL